MFFQDKLLLFLHSIYYIITKKLNHLKNDYYVHENLLKMMYFYYNLGLIKKKSIFE